MKFYEIAFWCTVSILLSLMSFFIWLCVQKTRDDRIMKISKIGLEYLISNYLSKCFQKLCILLLNNEKLQNKINKQNLLEHQTQFIHDFSKPFVKSILNYARGYEISEEISKNISLFTFEEINLFLFPDILVQNNDYYKELLGKTTRCIYQKSIDLDNQSSKEYIEKINFFKK